MYHLTLLLTAPSPSETLTRAQLLIVVAVFAAFTAGYTAGFRLARKP